MAVEGFGIYELLVESVFGSVLASFLGIAIVLIIYGYLMRMSPLLILMIVGTFTMVFMIGFAGAIGALLFGFLAISYFGWTVFNLLRRYVS